MTISHDQYERMAQDALRDVVRRVLQKLPVNGPSDENVFIGFRTSKGVGLSSALHARFPERMDVVIQHQYQNLEVGRAGFKIDLWFNGRLERLIVPYAALTRFYDPEAAFLLNFPELPSAQLPANDKVVSLAAFRKDHP